LTPLLRIPAKRAAKFGAMSALHDIEPYVSFKHPHDVYHDQPTFFFAEVLFLVLTALSLIDATTRPRGGLTFLACLVGGACVELLTILHKEVGNFYHSQAMIMLFGMREPLYMLLGCYGAIAYYSQMVARRLDERPLVEAAYAALLGSEAWALLDTVGAQFQWYAACPASPSPSLALALALIASAAAGGTGTTRSRSTPTARRACRSPPRFGSWPRAAASRSRCAPAPRAHRQCGASSRAPPPTWG
jgi:hypothetical protein